MNRKTRNGKNSGDKVAFVTALRDTLGIRGISQAELARRIPASESAVTKWVLGRGRPSPEHVFAMERALDLAAGHLSRLLGYCPCEDRHRPPGFEEAVLADPNLAPEHKKTLIGLYKGLSVSAP